ncbi:CAP domain-containing protein [Streptomyces sp. NPDC051742]|uniref:CAP domain-containing protein n=1 Tax=unclassified Streptomyces TaxID=2593676 RepID=UPI0034425CD2
MGASTEVVELIRAAQSGDPWARDRVIATHLPLVYNLLGRALNGHRALDELARQTMLRALDGLDGRDGPGGPGGPGGPRDPGGFRPWLLALALHAVREHAQRSSLPGAGGVPAAHGPDFADMTVERLRLSGRSREAVEAARWIEPEDSALLALWWLECGGEIGRHEVATALRWSVEHTAARWEGIRLRAEAARVVVAVLAADPPCQGLRYEAGTWDGHPSAPWREHLAWHIRGCVRCAACCDGLIPIEALVAGLPLVPPPTHLLADVRGPRAYDPAGRQEPVEPRTAPATPAATGPAVTPARTAQGPRSSRSTRRRRRQERERGRRRVIVTTGLAVMALAGGSFYLSPGRGGGGDGLNRAAAPAPDLPSGAHEPAGLTPAPSTSSGPASATASASPATPATPSLAARTKAAATSARPAPTATPAPVRTTAPRTSAPEPAPTRTGTGGGSDTGTGTGGGTGAGAQGGSGDGSVADQVISLVNAERAKAGCGPLAANATLAGAAQGHSDDMAARDFFDHTNPDGEGPGERVTEAGYPWSTYGENIAKGQSTPEQVMEAWMNSPGHRANILNCDFKEIGIGVHTEGGPYWTQVFGAR